MKKPIIFSVFFFIITAISSFGQDGGVWIDEIIEPNTRLRGGNLEINGNIYRIFPNSNLRNVDLTGANLTWSILAGSKLNVHHNTFYCPKTAVVIRGIPTKSAEIHHNWFHQSPTQLSIRTDGNTTITNNVYGHTNPQFLSQTVLPT